MKKFSVFFAAVLITALFAPYAIAAVGSNVQISLPAKADDADHYMDQGVAFSEKGDYTRAFDKVIELYPYFAPAHYNKGIALSQMGKDGDAVKEYDKAIELDPDNPKPYNNKGSALGRLGKVQEALISFERAIQLEPKYADAYYNKYVALKDLGRKQEASAALETARRLEPKIGE
jgi:tetratricopeptide (TPR) repeat protein